MIGAMRWDWVWMGIMTGWWAIGVAGTVLSVATLRVARAKRAMVANGRPRPLAAANNVVRSAWSRLVLFGFLVVDAPLVYAMFDIPSGATIGDRIRIAAPLGAVFGSAVALMAAGAVILALLVADTKDLLSR